MQPAYRILPILIAFTAAPLVAQVGRDTREIPADAKPPAGKCRIWLDGVPLAQQPAPTDCATAVRNRPMNAVVVFGPTIEPERDNAPSVAPIAVQFTGGKRTVLPIKSFRAAPPKTDSTRPSKPEQP